VLKHPQEIPSSTTSATVGHEPQRQQLPRPRTSTTSATKATNPISEVSKYKDKRHRQHTREPSLHGASVLLGERAFQGLGSLIPSLSATRGPCWHLPSAFLFTFIIRVVTPQPRTTQGWRPPVPHQQRCLNAEGMPVTPLLLYTLGSCRQGLG
jgi:hypothetical protein